MPTELSVVVDLSAADHTARPLLASLDAQTLPASRWETVVAAPPAGDPRRDLLDRIARARTNLLVVDADDVPLSAAAGAASAGRVLVLDPDDRLRPDALALLARRHGDLLLLAGEVGPGAPSARGALAEDGESVPAATLPGQTARLRMVAPREAVYAARAASRTDLAEQLLSRAGSVGVLASARVVEVADEPDEPSPWEDDGAPTPASTRATWSQGVLRLEVTHEQDGGTEPDETWLSLRHLERGDEIRLRTEAGSDGGPLVLRAELDLRGGPASSVDAGAWTVLTTAWSGDRRLRRRVPAPDDQGVALVDGRLVALRAGKRDRLRLEVGTVGASVVRGADPGRADITESARGTHLSLPVPTTHLHGVAPLPGRLHLGGLPVAATLQPTDGEVVLDAWMSGLPGHVALSTRFGTPKPVRSGLRLVIANDGVMSLEREPAASAAPEPAAGGPKPAAAEPGVPEQLVRRAVDRLPDGVRDDVRAGLGRARRGAVRLSRSLADRLDR